MWLKININEKKLFYRFSGLFNSFLISSGIITIFKLLMSDFDYGLWGIITSLVLILSIISQFIMPNLIEKDFIELDRKTMMTILISYFKLLFCVTPLLYFLIYGFYLNSNFYFNFKYLIPFLVTLLIVIENTINISNKIVISQENTKKFDAIEFFMIKYLRFFIFIFYFFYLNKNSFIDILIIHIAVRTISMIFIVKTYRSSFFSLKEFFLNRVELNIFKEFLVLMQKTFLQT